MTTILIILLTVTIISYNDNGNFSQKGFFILLFSNKNVYYNYYADNCDYSKHLIIVIIFTLTYVAIIKKLKNLKDKIICHNLNFFS